MNTTWMWLTGGVAATIWLAVISVAVGVELGFTAGGLFGFLLFLTTILIAVLACVYVWGNYIFPFLDKKDQKFNNRRSY